MKVINAKAAGELIRNGSTVYVGGFGAYSGVDELLHGLVTNLKETGSPKGLTVISGICSGFGNMENIGHNILTEPELVDTIIAGHFNIAPKMARMISENQVAAYALPLGVIPGMLRAGASGQPGILSKVGLKTYVDPEVEGCAVNEKAREQREKGKDADVKENCKAQEPGKSCKPQETGKNCKAQWAEIVKRVEFQGEDYLFYKALLPDACLIRGTFSDPDGNISLRREGLHEYQLEAAMAVKNNGGTVILQVDQLVPKESIDPKEVRIPGMLVDYVVVGSPENSRQMYGWEKYDPALSGEGRMAEEDIHPMPLDVRKVIARRAAMELKEERETAISTKEPSVKIATGEEPHGKRKAAEFESHEKRKATEFESHGKTEPTELNSIEGVNQFEKSVVNLGIGMPAGVGSVAAEEGLAEEMILSIETGPVGGIPLDGAAFAGAVNYDALMNAADVFAYYDGGGLDKAFLGAAEVDGAGNVNVSMFGTRCAGPGGFINITQNTPKVFFMGTFMAGEQDIRIHDGKLEIVKDGSAQKFTRQVQQITFSGDFAVEAGQKVLYITERAVFRLDQSGQMELIEIAPGIDLEKDILSKMGFKPKVSQKLKEMPPELFR